MWRSDVRHWWGPDWLILAGFPHNFVDSCRSTGWFAGLLWTMHKSEAFTRVMADSALLHEVSLIYQASSDLLIWQLGRDLGEWLEAHRASWGQVSELVSITLAICFGHFKSDHRDWGVGGGGVQSHIVERCCGLNCVPTQIQMLKGPDLRPTTSRAVRKFSFVQATQTKVFCYDSPSWLIQAAELTNTGTGGELGLLLQSSTAVTIFSFPFHGWHCVRNFANLISLMIIAVLLDEENESWGCQTCVRAHRY